MFLGLALAVLGANLYRNQASLRLLMEETGIQPAAELTEDIRLQMSHRAAQRLELGVGLLGIAMAVGAALSIAYTELHRIRSEGDATHELQATDNADRLGRRRNDTGGRLRGGNG